MAQQEDGEVDVPTFFESASKNSESRQKPEKEFNEVGEKVEQPVEAPKKEEAPKAKPLEKKNEDHIPYLSQLNVNSAFGVMRTDEFENDYYGDGE